MKILVSEFFFFLAQDKAKDKQHGNLFNTYKILQACHVVRIIKDLFQPSNSLLVVQDTFDAKLDDI